MKYLAVSILLVLSLQYALAQDATFSLPQAATLHTNPAFSQGDTLSRVSVAYQSPNEKDSYLSKAFQAQASVYLSKLNGNVSLQYLSISENFQYISSKQLALGYSQNFKIGNKFALKFGGAVGYILRNLDWNQFVFEDTQLKSVYSPIAPASPRASSVGKIDLSAGTSVQWNKVIFGIGYFHINCPNISVYVGETNLKSRFNYNLTYDWLLSENKNMHLYPMIEHTKQGDFTSWSFGGVFDWNGVQAGMKHQLNSDFSFIAGYSHPFGLAIHYAYIESTTKLTTVPTGVHEVALSFRFWKRSAHKNFVPVQGVYFD